MTNHFLPKGIKLAQVYKKGLHETLSTIFIIHLIKQTFTDSTSTDEFQTCQQSGVKYFANVAKH